MVGSHGREIRRSDSRTFVDPPTTEQREGLEAARDIAVNAGHERNLERKIASLALHTRMFPQDKATKIENVIFQEWSTITQEYRLECLRFNGGVEIRCLGRHKGDVVGELLQEQPRETLSVYVGDDVTDEDAFMVIREYGVGIKVGEPNTTTAATSFLRDCEEVKAFLEAWSSVASEV